MIYQELKDRVIEEVDLMFTVGTLQELLCETDDVLIDVIEHELFFMGLCKGVHEFVCSCLPYWRAYYTHCDQATMTAGIPLSECNIQV